MCVEGEKSLEVKNSLRDKSVPRRITNFYRCLSSYRSRPFAAVLAQSAVKISSSLLHPQTYTLAGIVTPAANGGGSTISLSGAANASTTADTAGNYSFNSLANGTYAVTPSRNGYVFSPPSQTITINGATPAPANFTATPQSAQTFSLSGTLSPAAGGGGATVKLSGASNATTIADSSGNYSFSALFKRQLHGYANQVWCHFRTE